MIDSSALGAPRPGAAQPRGFDGNVQAIASAAHLRGVVLVNAKGEVCGSLEAAELCRLLRAARENVRSDAHAFDHVGRLANGIAVGLGQRGAVQVSRNAWNLVTGYAARAAKKRSKA